MTCLALIMFILVNAERVIFMEYDHCLQDYANERANAQQDTLSHEGAIHSEILVRHNSIQEAFQALMASPDHRNILLDKRFTHTSIGIVEQYGYITVAQVLTTRGACKRPPQGAHDMKSHFLIGFR